MNVWDVKLATSCLKKKMSVELAMILKTEVLRNVKYASTQNWLMVFQSFSAKNVKLHLFWLIIDKTWPLELEEMFVIGV